MTAKKIIVAAADDDVFIPFIKKLTEVTVWQVSDYFLCYSSSDTPVFPQASFPSCQLHLPQDASRGLLPESMKHEVLPELDSEILARMQPYQGMYMSMFDIYDPDGRSFSARERRNAYFQMLRFGLYFIKRRRPDLLILGSIPNSLHDFMLYCLCRVHGSP